MGEHMKNKLVDLNNHLFAQMERLSDEDLAGEKLGEELARTKAITSVANQIILNARLALDAKISIQQNMIKNVPQMIGMDDYED
jgi:hypothetical protein